MGRAPKVGLDYFRLDVNLDEKFELIEAEFGLTGFAVVVRLYQRIYGGAGYYCEWDDEVALVFSSRNNLGANVVSEIVKAAIKRKLFDRSMFERYHILTSSGIQKWYFEAVSRRDRVEVIREYLLVSDTILPKNVNINRISADIKGISADINAHSKVKQSKGKESIDTLNNDSEKKELLPLNNTRGGLSGENREWLSFVKEYEGNIGLMPVSEVERGDLEFFFSRFGAGALTEFIHYTARKHPANPHVYFSSLCRKYLDRGITTAEQAKAVILDYDRQKGGRNGTDRGSDGGAPRQLYEGQNVV